MNDKNAVAEIRPGAGALMREPHPTSLQDIQRMAEAVAKSGLFGVKTPEQAMSLMLIAQAEGMHPAIAARDYDIIQGRPAKKSEAMLRSFLNSGGKVKWHQLDDTIADATFSHPAGGEVRIAWDIKRAATAGLSGKEMYKKFPRQMLRARTISEGVRTVCPMATSGMYVPEEIEDMGPEPVAAQVIVMPKARTEVAAAPPAAAAATTKPAMAEGPAGLREDQVKLREDQVKWLRERLATAQLSEKELCFANGLTDEGKPVEALAAGMKADMKKLADWIRAQVAQQ